MNLKIVLRQVNFQFLAPYPRPAILVGAMPPHSPFDKPNLTILTYPVYLYILHTQFIAHIFPYTEHKNHNDTNYQLTGKKSLLERTQGKAKLKIDTTIHTDMTKSVEIQN